MALKSFIAVLLIVLPCFGADELVLRRSSAFRPGIPSVSGISIVQAKKGKSGAGHVATSTLGAAATAGNLLVATTSHYSASLGATPISDNIGGTTGWVKIDEANYNPALGYASMWYKKNIPGGITAITATGVTTDYIVLVVQEITGASAGTPFTTGESGNSTGVATTNPQTATIATATAASIIIAVLSGGSSSPTLTLNGTGTIGTWNLFSTTECQELDDNDNQPTSVPNIVVGATGNQKHGWTTTLGQFVMIIGAFH